MRLLNKYTLVISTTNTKSKKFLAWIRKKISPQANMKKSNSALVDDWNKEETKEWPYPKKFKIGKDKYSWHMFKRPPYGSGYSLLFEGKAFGKYEKEIAIGNLTKAKLFKGFAIIYDYYN